MEKAPFNPVRRTAVAWSELDYPIMGCDWPGQPGRSIEARDLLSSLEAHTAKHVADGGWQPGTTPEAYLHSLRETVRAAGSLRVGIHRRAEKSAAFALASRVDPSALLVVPQRERCIFVVYNARRNHLETGYTVSRQVLPTLMSAWRPFSVV